MKKAFFISLFAILPMCADMNICTVDIRLLILDSIDAYAKDNKGSICNEEIHKEHS